MTSYGICLSNLLPLERQSVGPSILLQMAVFHSLLWLSSTPCLENPRDGGAWWAAVYGVAQSRTRLKRLSSSSSSKGFARSSAGKKSACNAGDLGLISGLGRSPREANSYPLQYSCLENSMDRGAWQAWDRRDSDMIEVTQHTYLLTLFFPKIHSVFSLISN